MEAVVHGFQQGPELADEERMAQAFYGQRWKGLLLTSTHIPLSRAQSCGPPRGRNAQQRCLWLEPCFLGQFYAIRGEHKLMPNCCPFSNTSLWRWDTINNYTHKYLSKSKFWKSKQVKEDIEVHIFCHKRAHWEMLVSCIKPSEYNPQVLSKWK